MNTFSEILDAAEKLEPEEQQRLSYILFQRNIENNRERLLSDIAHAGKEFKENKLKPQTVDEIMRDLES